MSLYIGSVAEPLGPADDQAGDIAHEMKDLDAKQTMLQGIMFVLQ